MKFELNRKEYDKIIEECIFTDNEKEVLEYLIRGWTIVQISINTNLSTSTVSRIKKSIINKIIKSDVFLK